MNLSTSEAVAYATAAGLSRELGHDAWSEEKIVVRAGEGGGGEDDGVDRIGRFEPKMEFAVDCAREVYPVKSTCTKLINLDLFVERRQTFERRGNRGE